SLAELRDAISVRTEEAMSGAVPRLHDPDGPARETGPAVHCAVPGTGDHPWGTLPYTLHNPENAP
ncbi:hypothetical protein ACWDZW_43365, partial [Streptomyces coeruleorubidus]